MTIWHKPGFHEAIDDKLKVSKDGKWVYWTMYGWNIPGKDAHDIGVKWCYLDDLLVLENKLKTAKKEIRILKNSVSQYFEKATDAYIKLHFLEERMKEDARNQRIADTMKIIEG
ncbi:MAG: hypothetical protein IKA10_04525 [Oscillospiraceae bacterium]|nr:hypothetical protein [Oscillospiraceae bacterium]